MKRAKINSLITVPRLSMCKGYYLVVVSIHFTIPLSLQSEAVALVGTSIM